MPAKLQRLFVTTKLEPGIVVALDKEQAHYLGNVLRLKRGDEILLFNGSDGEWLAELDAVGKKEAQARLHHQTRPQDEGPDLHYLFAPLKRARLDYMVQKATELGVSALRPVITRHTVAERVKPARVLANAIEAAEQCGVLRVPAIMEPEKLQTLLGAWDEKRLLIFADESAPHASPIETLRSGHPGPVAVLVGPEGGFEREERAALLAKPYVLPISLGPRVMRADTAAVAALALVNAVRGDWQ